MGRREGREKGKKGSEGDKKTPLLPEKNSISSYWSTLRGGAAYSEANETAYNTKKIVLLQFYCRCEDSLSRTYISSLSFAPYLRSLRYGNFIGSAPNGAPTSLKSIVNADVGRRTNFCESRCLTWAVVLSKLNRCDHVWSSK